MSLVGKRVVLLLARERYREEELDEPRRALEAAGAEVRLASSSLGIARGMSGGSAYPDLLLGAVRLDELDALVLVGGTGASEYWDDRVAQRLVREAVQEGKLVGAICLASATLGAAGVLQGLEATGHPTCVSRLRREGAITTGAAVTRSGNVVTGRGPEDSQAFGRALVAALSDVQSARSRWRQGGGPGLPVSGPPPRLT